MSRYPDKVRLVGTETDTDEKLRTLLTIVRHRELVGDYLESLAGYFRYRAREHDRTKLQLDEFDGFAEINRTARDHAYGSEEYDASLAAAKADGGCIALHFSRNRHHPEYFKSVKDMGLFDLMEMVIDWKAASETYGRASMAEGLAVHRNRFDFDDWQWKVIEEMVRFVEPPRAEQVDFLTRPPDPERLKTDRARKSIDGILELLERQSKFDVLGKLIAYGLTYSEGAALIMSHLEKTEHDRTRPEG